MTDVVMTSGDVVTPIPVEDRTVAALTHLSGLAGYVIPLGGAIVPAVIWMMYKDTNHLISTVAKQALWLNLMFWVMFIGGALLMATVILIPFVFIFWVVIGVAAVVLPIIGAIKANQGTYYKYPVVGLTVS